MGKTPEQVGALCNTMGDQRSSSLYVGAVKTNVSHLEGAAGIAGLLKVPWLVVVEAAVVGSELENCEELTERQNQIPSGWWFQTCFIFHSIWDNPSH